MKKTSSTTTCIHMSRFAQNVSGLKLDWVEVVTGKKEPEIEFWNPPGGFTRARTLVKSLKYKPIKGGE